MRTKLNLGVRLFVIRHGDIDSGRRFYGHLDVPLSDRGRRQAEAAAAALEPVELHAVYSSDLSRALDGARLIAEPRGLTVQADPAFREMSLGVLEGHPRDEPHEHHPATTEKWYSDMVAFAFPGGEDFRAVRRRVDPALEALLASHAGQTVALVAHNSVTRIVIGRALDVPLSSIFAFEQSFGCVNQVNFDRPRSPHGSLRLLNWTPSGPC